MASMKPGDRVRHTDGRRGTIFPGGSRRPSPASDPEPDTIHTHWDIRWDTTGVDSNPVRAKDLQVLYKFSDSDLQFIRSRDPKEYKAEGTDEFGDEFSFQFGQDTLIVTAAENGGAVWRFETNPTSGLSSFKRLEKNVADAYQVALRHWQEVNTKGG